MNHTLIYEHAGDSITHDAAAGTTRVRFSRDENEKPVDVTFRDTEMMVIVALWDKVKLIEGHK